VLRPHREEGSQHQKTQRAVQDVAFFVRLAHFGSLQEDTILPVGSQHKTQEGTFSQGVRCHGLRRSRYCGWAKSHLPNVAIACAINLQRLDDYWSGIHAATTRISPFARLARHVM
jgi:hypothetical protein